MFWVLKRTDSLWRFFWVPTAWQHKFWLKNKKIKSTHSYLEVWLYVYTISTTFSWNDILNLMKHCAPTICLSIKMVLFCLYYSSFRISWPNIMIIFQTSCLKALQRKITRKNKITIDQLNQVILLPSSISRLILKLLPVIALEISCLQNFSSQCPNQ